MPKAAALALALTAALAGCDGDNAPDEETLDVEVEVGAEVAMVDTSFRPADVTVSPGDMVTFVNRSEVEHTVTTDRLLFDSGRLLPGEEFGYLTEADAAAAVIEYHCEVHPRQMRGRIVVSAGKGQENG